MMAVVLSEQEISEQMRTPRNCSSHFLILQLLLQTCSSQQRVSAVALLHKPPYWWLHPLQAVCALGKYCTPRTTVTTRWSLYICQLLEPYISNVTHRNHALTVPQTVCIALRFFATVCRAIHKAVGALTELVDAFVVFPGHLPTQCIKEGFYDIAGFPRVLGAIDCTHIPISAHLGENEADFGNRKAFHSLNIQMTCDHQMMVSSVVAKWPGSVHDSRRFRESLLCPKLEQGQFSGVLLGERLCLSALSPDPLS
ncbi:putative nuclease HARBI1 isoform X1 [Antennarius striatus]|uniref:putative nuclease HARBI1 isoform X1 n=1 Tax=Antennarius striatus TaxID=241820 RepID=UPI0035B0A22D